MRTSLVRFVLCLSCLVLGTYQAFAATAPAAASQGAASEDLISGLSPWQVCPAGADFRAKVMFRPLINKGQLRVEVVETQSREIVADALYEIDPTASAKYEVPSDSQTAVKTSAKDLAVGKIPLNNKGDYTFRFTSGQKTQEVEHVLVGEVWVVGGGTNAYGAPARRKLASNPMVHCFIDGKWQEGTDPIFPPIEIGAGNDSLLLTPWLRAAQDYTSLTGVPVGIVGWAMPELHLDATGSSLAGLKTLLEKNAKNASVLLWFQGETEAGPQSAQYGGSLKKLAEVVRKATDNPNLLLVLCQVPSFKDPKGVGNTPAWGRIRETQRRFCAEDKYAILVPTMYLTQRAPALLDEEGVTNLGIRLGEVLSGTNKSKKPVWQGPRFQRAQFIDTAHQTVRVWFENTTPRLLVRTNSQTDWAVTDDKHLGYAEITPPDVRDGVLTFQLTGARCGTLESGASDSSVKLKLQDTGYINATNITVKGKDFLDIDLAQPATTGAKLHYAFLDECVGSFQDGDARYAAAFMDQPINEPGQQKNLTTTTPLPTPVPTPRPTAAPTPVPTPALPPAPKGTLGLGSWKTQVEFKDVQITSGDDKVLYKSEKATDLKGWKSKVGKWEMKDGVISQTGNDTPAILLFETALENRTLTCKARKTGGDEGIIVLFPSTGGGEKEWWNLGGWSNKQSGMEGDDLGTPERVNATMVQNRWYDIKIEIKAQQVQCYVNNVLLHDVTRK
ncbi:TPA: hypothetical protein DDW35_02045 [Candidatus Sumerlaeota bacterium]|jgi:hypothetical protein|nr:hypothetical protein [Candidatus Sumerlaeota bacterium]